MSTESTTSTGIEIIFQDSYFAIINKPSGLAFFPGDKDSSSLWDNLKTIFPDKNLYPVHRVDKGTSGLVIIAFSQKVQAELNRQFQTRSVEKFYLAICLGKIEPPNGKIDLPLCPGRQRRFRVAGPRKEIFLDQAPEIPTWTIPANATFDVDSPSQKHYPSQTYYQTIYANQDYSLLLLKPLTGRTHQIRVHLAWLGHPLLGDNLYGKPKSAKQRSNRLALHSFRLKFSQNWLEEEEQIKAFKAPLPAFFQEAISKNILPNFQEKIALERELSRAIKAFSA